MNTKKSISIVLLMIILGIILLIIVLPRSITFDNESYGSADIDNSSNQIYYYSINNPSNDLLEDDEIIHDEIIHDEKLKESIKTSVRYTTSRVNVRLKPSTNSKVVDILEFNSKIECYKYNNNWLVIIIDNNQYYISKKYTSKTEMIKKSYDVPSNSGWKSWMPYTAITSETSSQKKLQDYYAYTGNYGIRMINNRFCVALGSYFNCPIGQYLTLVLKNGTEIPCVMSDSKADKDTDSSNIFTKFNGCMSEFIVSSSLNKDAKKSGNISSVNKSWDSPVVKVIIYDYNVLE